MFGMFGKLSAVQPTMAAKATTTTPKTVALRTRVRRQEAAQAAQRQKAAQILAAGQRRVERAATVAMQEKAKEEKNVKERRAQAGAVPLGGNGRLQGAWLQRQIDGERAMYGELEPAVRSTQRIRRAKVCDLPRRPWGRPAGTGVARARGRLGVPGTDECARHVGEGRGYAERRRSVRPIGDTLLQVLRRKWLGVVEAALERKARDVAKQVARSPVAINRRLAEEATDEDYMVMHTAMLGNARAQRNASKRQTRVQPGTQ